MWVNYTNKLGMSFIKLDKSFVEKKCSIWDKKIGDNKGRVQKINSGIFHSVWGGGSAPDFPLRKKNMGLKH